MNKKHYDGTVFHRVIDGFMIQGGGFTQEGQVLTEKPTGKGIVNEGQNGLKNDRGTIAMARTSDPNSATAQFFINVVDNAMLNYPSNGGYAVFGKVVEGMDVVDKIKAVTTRARSPALGGDVPGGTRDHQPSATVRVMQLWLCPLIAFLFGSIPFGLIIAKAKGINIREHGSGNIGATNVLRVVGKKYGITCLMLDALKGFIPVVHRHQSDPDRGPNDPSAASALSMPCALILPVAEAMQGQTRASPHRACAPCSATTIRRGSASRAARASPPPPACCSR